MMNKLKELTLLAMVLLTGCKHIDDNPTLALMAAGDQQDRASQKELVVKNDIERLQAVKRLLKQDSIKTANDHFNAALILQHSYFTDDFLLANKLANEAVRLDPDHKDAKLMIAQSWDRYLDSRNLPQWYGTQRYARDGKEYLMEMDTTKVTDEERKKLGIRTLKENLEFFNRMHGRRETSLNAYMITKETIAGWNSLSPVELVGGEDTMIKQLKYPAVAAAKGVTGKVLVQFTVDPEGNVKDAIVVEGLGHGCDEEALRVVNQAKYRNEKGEDHEVRVRLPFGI